SILRQEANLILDKVAADLRNYPASKIRIAAYTDATHDADANRELSFRRAKTVEQYLARTLGNQHRWLVIGYGETHPLTAHDTDTTANQQRNRRIEIAVNSISTP
ncbi:MAG: OmpA family protein, partial [Coleofasciculus sp. Co-bin14]|nr:OmpA family protein [Coleofasciculus sp. Co-bin14]